MGLHTERQDEMLHPGFTDPALVLGGIHPQIGGYDRDIELPGQKDGGQSGPGSQVEDAGAWLED
jgi:hypothetical protein